MNMLPRRLKSEKGIALPLVAVALWVILGMTGLGVETGRLALVATEVQNAADVAARSAAFEYVTGDGTTTPRQAAEAVIAANAIDDQTSISAASLTVLEMGNWTSENGFITNLEPINAARAEVQHTADSIIMSWVGYPSSLVTKDAIAGFSPASGGRPTLPIAIGECLLDEECNEDACQPTLYQVPDPEDNSAWTGFFEEASGDQIAAYFPEECPPNGNGTTEVAPYINLHDEIYLNNGQTSLLKQVECMLENGLTEVLVPVVSCGTTLNQAREVLGFATFEIIEVRATGGNKGIDMRGLTSAQNDPGGGDTSYGSGTIVLVD
jgi:Flp pilus assembly protein TadG